LKARIQVIVGPTASGKTDYALQLAKKTSAAVISADSRQIYTGMDIGTAKPRELWGALGHDILTADMVDGVPHYLFNIATPDTQMSLSEWQSHAKKVLEFLVAKGQDVVLAGGTMLYVDSLRDWYEIPEVPPNEALRMELEAKPAEELYAELMKKDPAAKEFIEPLNTRRIIRALEVMAATGRPFSESRRRNPTSQSFAGCGEAPYDFVVTGLSPAWDVLKERITKRVAAMMTDGLLDETKKLQEKYGADLPLLQTMYYREAADVLSGKLTQEEALAEMVKVNMRYARRQMNWWKRRTDIKWI
jgi:tRNA dimethylallyltransferase